MKDKRIDGKIKMFVERLLSRHRIHYVEFPWRKTKDPYKILVAEILLRKTTRNQVNEVFEKIVKKYPNAQSLAEADISELEEMIKPLGMHKKRSMLLKEIGKYIVEKFNGVLPKRIEELKRIPGVGDYTANAVLCLAYNIPLPMVDTNTIRIIERVFHFKSQKKRPRTDVELWKFVKKIVPNNKGKEFNLAVLDFANLICTPKSPQCEHCPIKEICLSYKNFHAHSKSS